MIADVLVQHPWLVPVALALLILVGPFVGAWLVPRPRLALTVAVLSLLPLAALTLVPVERELYGVCAIDWTLPTIGRVEAFANLALFVPPVLLAGVATRSPVLVFGGGVVLSAGIEAFQAAVPSLGRSCDTGDWLANVLGALLGAVLAAIALALARRRSRGRAASGPAHRDAGNETSVRSSRTG